MYNIVRYKLSKHSKIQKFKKHKIMKTHFIVLLVMTLITQFSCSKSESSSNCDFIGEWCLDLGFGSCKDFNGNMTTAPFIIKSDGEMIQNGVPYTWKSDNCSTVEATLKSASIISIWTLTVKDSNILVFDPGFGVTQEYTRK